MIAKENYRILGAMSEETLNQYKTNMMMLILMQFKNWIPGLASARFNKMKYDYDYEDFLEGRFTSLFNNIWSGKDSWIKKSVKTFGFFSMNIPILGFFSRYIPALSGLKKTNEDIARLQFDVYYRANKDIFKDMSYNEAFKKFVNKREQNLRAMGREIQLLFSFMLLLLLLGNMGDDDEDKQMRSSFTYRALSRGAMELGFFFNPNDAYTIVKRPLPILGIIQDAISLELRLPGSSSLKQLFGDTDKLFIEKK